jgi:hypothetical protein
MISIAGIIRGINGLILKIIFLNILYVVPAAPVRGASRLPEKP